mmetsp:Transcript_30866/g.80963  ORF Transcript_30866/g.80963 Transcript_30866/m.80963 type:complete len:99 (+) Transcript_30866:3107-3403(+)
MCLGKGEERKAKITHKRRHGGEPLVLFPQWLFLLAFANLSSTHAYPFLDIIISREEGDDTVLTDLSPVERTNEANYFNVLLLPLFLPKKRNHKKGPRF